MAWAAVWPVMASLIAIYMVSQFLRNSTGVIAPDIARDLAVGPEALGWLSSAFFLSFALAQIPVGAMIDRFGPKRTMLGSLLLAVAGSALFGAADSLTGLVLARVLMGLGCSTFYVAPLAIYARGFAPRYFSRLVGLQLGLGSLGALLATAPLGYLAALTGWQASFALVAAATLMMGLVVAWVLPPESSGQRETPASFAQSLSGIGAVLRTRGLWPLVAMNFATYSAFVTVLGLWGGPLLADLHGLDLKARGQVLLLMSAAQIGGVLLWGMADRHFRSRKWPVACGATVAIASLLSLAALVDGPIWAITLAMIGLGAASAYMPVLVAHGKELFPEPLVGRGITVLNLANMGGVFVLQLGTAYVIGAWSPADATGPPTVEAYRAMLISLAIVFALALAGYSRAPETRGSANNA